MTRETWHRWYSTARWQKIRARQLQAEPLCAMCITVDLVTLASVCDHTEPHRGDQVKFWGGPFQSLCQHHHNSTKQSHEKGGSAPVEAPRRKGSDINGWPLDANHPWRANR